MKNKTMSVAFIVFIWTTLVLFIAYDAYEKFKTINGAIINLKTMKDLTDGNS